MSGLMVHIGSTSRDHVGGDRMGGVDGKSSMDRRGCVLEAKWTLLGIAGMRHTSANQNYHIPMIHHRIVII